MLEPFVIEGACVSDLDRMAEEFIISRGARPAFKGYLGFPATLCVSIDDAVVHGIPGKDILKSGQIVGIDCGAEKDGYFGDHARTFSVGKITNDKQKELGYMDNVKINVVQNINIIKNMILKYMEQEKKRSPDHAYTLIEALNLSPPIGIKARKLYSATQTWEFNRDVIKHMSKTDIDNPMYSAMFSLIEATTNVPLSRAYNKMKNVREALDDDNEMWQRVALLMGWNRWDLGVQDDKIMDIKNLEDILSFKESKVLEYINNSSTTY